MREIGRIEKLGDREIGDKSKKGQNMLAFYKHRNVIY